MYKFLMKQAKYQDWWADNDFDSNKVEIKAVNAALNGLQVYALAVNAASTLTKPFPPHFFLLLHLRSLSVRKVRGKCRGKCLFFYYYTLHFQGVLRQSGITFSISNLLKKLSLSILGKIKIFQVMSVRRFFEMQRFWIGVKWLAGKLGSSCKLNLEYIYIYLEPECSEMKNLDAMSALKTTQFTTTSRKK